MADEPFATRKRFIEIVDIGLMDSVIGGVLGPVARPASPGGRPTAPQWVSRSATSSRAWARWSPGAAGVGEGRVKIS